ncbi:MAG TPA: hypothetical protein VM802_06000 [Chitinophaga sp.]|uniref:hypothetical protein n=1 Tax=Chitinophaga sp. TaxID=1869181 RepID=UPI002BC0F9B2|nr:hypothetical protein [Chitinophaga sp.]HVI44398.1 hypothetical protein [Chitinophaga sp.]
MMIRVDFYGKGKELLFTCSFTDHADAELLIADVLVDDQYCENGPYSMLYTDSLGREIHTYYLCEIPPATAAAFARAVAAQREHDKDDTISA